MLLRVDVAAVAVKKRRVERGSCLGPWRRRFVNIDMIQKMMRTPRGKVWLMGKSCPLQAFQSGKKHLHPFPSA
jgi:hypothetical protein